MTDQKAQLLDLARQFLEETRGLDARSTIRQLSAALRDARNLVTDLCIELSPPQPPKTPRRQKAVESREIAPGVQQTKYQLFQSPIDRPWWGPFLVAIHTAREMEAFTHFEITLEGDLYDEEVGMLSRPRAYGGEDWQRHVTKEQVPIIRLFGWRMG
jgi:hypothetical protein